MSRKYRHISEYETKIISMVNQGYTLRGIGNKLGFTYNEIQNLKTRYNKKQIIVEAGKTLKKKGRPCKKRRYSAFNRKAGQTGSNQICISKQRKIY